MIYDYIDCMIWKLHALCTYIVLDSVVANDHSIGCELIIITLSI